MVIDAELGREDHGSIPHNCDREDALSASSLHFTGL
jgi:hypothetical protein